MNVITLLATVTFSFTVPTMDESTTVTTLPNGKMAAHYVLVPPHSAAVAVFMRTGPSTYFTNPALGSLILDSEVAVRGTRITRTYNTTGYPPGWWHTKITVGRTATTGNHPWLMSREVQKVLIPK